MIVVVLKMVLNVFARKANIFVISCPESLIIKTASIKQIITLDTSKI